MRRGEFYVTVYLGGFTLPMNFACILNFSCPEDECVLHNHMAERRIITNCHDAFGSGVLEHDVSNLEDTLPVAAVLGVADPDGLLGVVRLVLIVLLHISIWQEEFRGVGIDRPLDQLDMAGHVEARSPAGVPAILKYIIGIIQMYHKNLSKNILMRQRDIRLNRTGVGVVM